MNDDLDDFDDDLPPPQSQSLFDPCEPSSTEIAFREVQELCTPTQHNIKPMRQTQLESEFYLYKTFDKIAYKQCKYCLKIFFIPLFVSIPGSIHEFLSYNETFS